MTVAMASDYFGVTTRTINNLYNQFRAEFADDDVKLMNGAEVVEILEMSGAKLKSNGCFILAHWNGQTFTIPKMKHNLFSRKAMLRLALLIKNNGVGNMIREYITNQCASDSDFFVGSPSNRMTYGDDVYVINDLPTISGINLITTEMIDNYAGAVKGTAENLVSLHYDELFECGIMQIKKNALRKKFNKEGIAYENEKHAMTVKLSDESSYRLTKFKYFLTVKAVLRLIMFMTTEKARRIQRKLRERKNVSGSNASGETNDYLEAILFELQAEADEWCSQNEKIRKENERMMALFSSISKELSCVI